MQSNKEILFENSFVINLASRTDRMQKTSDRLNAVSIPFTRIEAVDGDTLNIVENLEERYSKGAEAVIQTTINILSLAISQNLPRVFIFEDDIMFNLDFEKYLDSVKLPTEFDMFYLGHESDLNSETLTESFRVQKCRNTWLCHAYCIQGVSFYQKVIDTLNANKGKTLDWIYVNVLQKEAKAFCTSKSVIHQESGYSNIAKADISWGRM